MVHSSFALRSEAHYNQWRALPEALLRAIPSPPSWHPKISPYRFIVLTSTIGLGTAKAVLTQRGSTLGSITLEWITGTVVFLLLFSISAYDVSEEVVPPFLSWLFKPDCMNYFWPLLASFTHMKRPVYDSGEKSTIFNPLARHPPISPYRILVCSVVTAFGMSKAVLGYYGLSTAMTWTDWALAVPVTTFLYGLGLYEYNTSNVWSSFFVEDQSEIFYSVSIGAQHTIGVCLSSAWSLGCAYVLRHITYAPDWDFKSTRPDNSRITLRTHIEDVGNLGFKLLLQEFIVGAILAGLAILFLLLRSIVHDVAARGGLVRRALRTAQRLIFRTDAKFPPWLTGNQEWTRRSSLFSFRRYSENVVGPVHFIFRLFFHVFLHVFGIAGCLAFGMSQLYMVLTIFDIIRKEEWFLLRVGYFPFLVIATFMPFVFLFWMLFLVISLLTSFSKEI